MRAVWSGAPSKFRVILAISFKMSIVRNLIWCVLSTPALISLHRNDLGHLKKIGGLIVSVLPLSDDFPML